MPRPSPARAVAVAYICALMMTGIDMQIVNVALPTLSRDFDAPLSDVQWTVIAYVLTLAVVIPASGWIGDNIALTTTIVAGAGGTATAAFHDAYLAAAILAEIGTRLAWTLIDTGLARPTMTRRPAAFSRSLRVTGVQQGGQSHRLGPWAGDGPPTRQPAVGRCLSRSRNLRRRRLSGRQGLPCGKESRGRPKPLAI